MPLKLVPGLSARSELCSAHRFVVLTVKALLCRLWLDDVVLAVERKRGWDTLLKNDTHHYAVGLLASSCNTLKKRKWLIRSCSSCQAICRVTAKKCVAWCLEASSYSARVPGRREELAEHVLAGRLQSFPERLMELLKDEDGELVGLTLSVLRKMLQDNKVAIAIPIGLQLAEVLRPLFDNR